MPERLVPDDAAPAEEGTGLKRLRTWRSVYWAVMVSFGVVVLLLTFLTQRYS